MDKDLPADPPEDESRSPWPLRLARLGAVVALIGLIGHLFSHAEVWQWMGYGGVALWLLMFAVDI